MTPTAAVGRFATTMLPALVWVVFVAGTFFGGFAVLASLLWRATR